MQAQRVLADLQAVAHWVCWPRTVDRFYYGDPRAEVKGIATTWSATNAALAEAARRGLNLVICHEPPFYDPLQTSIAGDLIRQKTALLDKLGLTLMRCHDAWDRMPGFGIVDAWADALGFPSEPRPVQSFYRICLLPGLSAREAAQEVAKRVLPYGQEAVELLGNPAQHVERLAIGTGAICNLPDMLALKADAALMTDDGMRNWWDTGMWALDAGVPLLAVNHSTAELPGMQAMARYFAEKYPGLPAEFVRDGFPPAAVVAQ